MDDRGRKIVVAVDESEESMHALSWSLKNIFRQNTENTLVLLYVKPPPPPYSSFDGVGNLFSGEIISTMEKYNRDLVNSVMEKAEAIYSNTQITINVEKLVGSGDAKYVICETVQKLKADALVMGSHGYGFVKRVLMGSVSDYCAKHVKCPVVIVKQKK